MEEINTTQIFTICALSNISSLQYVEKEKLLETSERYIDRVLSHPNIINKIGKWHRIWGPCIYSGKSSKKIIADNAFFAAVDKKGKTITISISGTNPLSLYGWKNEDFLINETAVWPFCKDSKKDDIRITMGTYRGFMHIIDQKFNNCNIKSFLKAYLHKHKTVERIIITGHSLGAPLALTCSLWLDESRSDWCEGKMIPIGCYSFAGASAGNRSFSNYVESRLKKNSFHYFRFFNRLDIVPYAWSHKNIDKLTQLYEPEIRTPSIMRKLQEWGMENSKKFEYQHVYENTPPMDELKFPLILDTATMSYLNTLSRGKGNDQLVSMSNTTSLEQNNYNSSQKSFFNANFSMLLKRANLFKRLSNTYRYSIKIFLEHTEKYFVLLEMTDVLDYFLNEEFNLAFTKRDNKFLILCHSLNQKFIHPILFKLFRASLEGKGHTRHTHV